MSTISQIDKNFEIKAPSTREDTVFINATEPAFEINGVYYEDGKFRRLPDNDRAGAYDHYSFDICSLCHFAPLY